MKLASLFSGGKDSAFALYLAQQMGHEIECVVNIVSKNEESWIFHTPNTNAVPVMSESLGIPLRTAITDGTEEGDLKALKEALKGLDVEGVVIGALWSDYQWDRMNRIFGELNLVTVAPLWRKNQEIVYDEMISAGIDAIIVGTFADGFNEKWLGKKLDAKTKKDLLALNKKYGVSIMGEGGEYESMVLDSPSFSKKLSVKSYNVKNTKNTFVMNTEKIDLVNKSQ